MKNFSDCKKRSCIIGIKEMSKKEKMIKMQNNITNFLHHAKLFDFSNQRTFWNVPSLNLDNR